MSPLLAHRVIFLNRPLTSEVGNEVIEQFLLLDAADHEARIDLYINCPGGSVTQGLAVLDAISCVRAPVSTICIGQACSMAAWILAAGTPGLRLATPSSEVMIHQVAGGFSGNTDDIQFYMERVVALQNRLVQMLAGTTGQAPARIRTDMERDFWMSATQARDYGLVDSVVEPFKKPPFGEKRSKKQGTTSRD